MGRYNEATNWVQIGQVLKRQTDLYANINPGPEPFADGATVINAQLRDKINEIINNPPETFGRFKAGDLVVAAGDDSNALDIIIDALSATQAYDLEITSVTTSGAPLEFGQTEGTISLNGQVTSVNFNLLNEAQNNIVPTEYKWYYRELRNPSGTWEVAQDWTDIPENNFSSNTPTKTTLNTHI